LDPEKEENSFPRDTSIHAKVGSAAKIVATSDLKAAKNSGCLRNPLEGIEIRWLSIERGAADLSNVLQLLALAAVIAFGEGLSEKKVELAAGLLSGQAFDQCPAARYVRFDVKVQRVMGSFTTPHFILDIWIMRLLLAVAWSPIDDASSRQQGSSLTYVSGVGSVLRAAIFALRRLLFVASKIKRSEGVWDYRVSLAHRKVVMIRPQRLQLICLRSFSDTKSGRKSRDCLSHWYGSYVNTDAIIETVENIRKLIGQVADWNVAPSDFIPPVRNCVATRSRWGCGIRVEEAFIRC
jgi:hypothetical protein